ncbi:hypothetical protein ACQQCD_04745 [Pseudarthrobacter sp. J1763]|uniref:hypothetical protein n=1 Tax=Pseudarthrobacter sp. J1763 TaxID=3420445 RepID=UPI003D296899
MGVFSEGLHVECAPSGQPLAVTWAGTEYLVCAEPLRWFERRQWWAEESRAPLGSGAGLVDHKIWRLQLQAGTQEITVELVHYVAANRWRLLKTHHTLDSRSA